MRTIDVPARDLDGPQGILRSLDDLARRRLLDDAATAARQLHGRRVFHVSSAHGAAIADGVLGVAVLLRTSVPLMRAAGIDTRWLHIDATSEVDEIAWRLHHMLHGTRPGESFAAVTPTDSAQYEVTLAEDARELADTVAQGDIVVLHDPATAGLAPAANAAGAHVVWRCHVGTDVPDETTDAAWAFLAPYLESCARIVVSRQQYAPSFLENTTVITPTIAPGTVTNAPMDSRTVRDMVRISGAVEGATADMAASFTRSDGTEHLVSRDCVTVLAGTPVPQGVRTVVQIGRWDRWKDPAGVLMSWEEGIDRLPDDAHLVLAGPHPTPGSSAASVLADLCSMWQSLDVEVRGRTHILTLPTQDPEENAALVGALQRYATVVVQKSLAEGWGLTVTEAMYKGKPVVASAVGGIQDQITHGEDGLLLTDPYDLAGFIDLIATVLDDERLAISLGQAGETRVQREHLPDRSLAAWWRLFRELVGSEEEPPLYFG